MSPKIPASLVGQIEQGLFVWSINGLMGCTVDPDSNHISPPIPLHDYDKFGIEISRPTPTPEQVSKILRLVAEARPTWKGLPASWEDYTSRGRRRYDRPAI